jgi:outer membrane protein TolC
VLRRLRLGVFLPVLLAAHSAFALQPLMHFLESAKTRNPEVKEATANAKVQEADADASLGQLLPSVSARGVYTHNQYEGAFEMPQADGTTSRLVFQPQNQLDAVLSLNVPIVDLPGQARLRAGRAVARAADQERSAAVVSIFEQVAVAYQRTVGSYAMLAAAEKSASTSQESLKLVEDRKAAGAASELDASRAHAAVEKALSDVEETRLSLSLARRQLHALSGLAPDVLVPSRKETPSLVSETALEFWLERAAQTPAAAASKTAIDAASEGRLAGSLAYLPTLSAAFDQRFTNATGFIGRTSVYNITATLQWQFDLSVPAKARSLKASAEAAEARAEKQLTAIREHVAEQWHRVQTNIAKVKASRAQREAAQLAERLAKERYSAGATTQVELTLSQREAFEADALNVQSEADLELSRTLLRILTRSKDESREP